MGNNLCRERIARADNSKNPIDRIIGRCAQICPANEVKPNYWQKHVLQTGPPTRTQPQSVDGWRKVTLSVPNGKSNNEGGGDLGETPIAPPRRKRSSVIDRQPVGFKELFGNNVSRRSSCDSILKDEHLAPLSEREQEMLQQKRKSKSISDFNLNDLKATDSLSISTIRIPVTRTLSLIERAMVQQSTIPAPRPALQRKISRVGNKKSDKFFGENLSDCLSDDPITPEPEPTSISFTYHTISTLITPIQHSQCVDVKDKLDEFVSANIPIANDVDGHRTVYTSYIEPNEMSKPFTVSECIDARKNVDRKSSLDKKAEFLMAMLEGTNASPVKIAPEETNKVLTPPRRSHLKKKQQIQPNEHRATVEGATEINSKKEFVTNSPIAVDSHMNALQHSNESPVVNRSIDLNNKEGGTKNDPKVNDIDYVGGEYDAMYRGMTPVEEPVIVPRRRITKHICDVDDDHHHHQHHHHHIKKHIDNNNHPSNALNHSENKENVPNSSMSDKEIEQYIILHVTHSSPEKPKRDFSSVAARTNQKQPENSTPVIPKANANQLDRPVVAPRVRHLSQDSLMPKVTSAPIVGADPLELVLKKYTSQQSFFTQDLLNQLSDRIYNIGFRGDPFDPSDTCDDGSGKCTPNSKLTTRKISAHRKESTVTRPILENDTLDCANVDRAPKIVQMDEKEPKTLATILPASSSNTNNLHTSTTNDNEMDNEIELTALKSNTETTIEQPKSAIEQFILNEKENSSVCDDRNETIATASASESKQMPVTVASKLDDGLGDCHKTNINAISNDLKSNCNSANSSSGSFAPLANTEDTSLEASNSSDDENTDSDTTVKTELNSNVGALTKLHGGIKRDSIIEVDAWFLRHNHLLDYSRRSSESQIAYDTRKVFPFGHSEPGAGTAFFETKTLSKSVENMPNDNHSTKIEPTSTTKTTSISPNPTELTTNQTDTSVTDHSILLKYLK